MITEEILIGKVRMLLGEASGDSGVSLITDDTLQLDKHIKALLPEAVLFVQMNKASGVVNVKCTISCDVNVNSVVGGVVVTLPTDYVRLVALKLSCWDTACHVTFPVGSKMDAIQRNKYLRAGKSSPACIEGVDDANKVILTAYPVHSDDDVSLENFIYEARYNEGEGITGGDEALVKAVAYQCAALLCNVLEKPECANTFQTYAAALCNNK